jgi:hypothetical protein
MLMLQHSVTALDVQVEIVRVVDAHKDLKVSLNIDLPYIQHRIELAHSSNTVAAQTAVRI